MYRVIEPGKVAIVFGAITMMSGIIGVPLGMFLSTELKVEKCFRIRMMNRIIIIFCSLMLFDYVYFVRINQ